MSSIGERQLSDALAREGVAVCPHLESIRLPDGIARPDIIIPATRSIVEYDGSYWHHGAKNHDRDVEKSRLVFAEAETTLFRVTRSTPVVSG